MGETSPLRTMSVEEYLRFDESSPLKHEYVSGELYALSGTTVRHNRIAGNVFATLLAAADDGPCDVFVNDMRLEVAADKYYYPDVLVICAPIGELDMVAREPCVVVEVTSSSTARIDRGEKLVAYKQVVGLRAYLIVDHRRRRVEQYWRDASDDEWRREEVVTEGRLKIPCLDVELTVDEIYRRVDLPAVGEPDLVEYET